MVRVYNVTLIRYTLVFDTHTYFYNNRSAIDKC